MIRVSGPSAEFSFSRGERKSIRSRIPTVAPPTLVPFLLHRFVCTPRSGGRQARVMRKANGIFAGVA